MKWKILLVILVLTGVLVVALYFDSLSLNHESSSPLIVNELLESNIEFNVNEILEMNLEEGNFLFQTEIKNNTEHDVFLGDMDFEFFYRNEWRFFSNSDSEIRGPDFIESKETFVDHRGIGGFILPSNAPGLVRIRQTVWTTPYHTPGTEHDLVVEIDLNE